jgi:hypothetical protein
VTDREAAIVVLGLYDASVTLSIRGSDAMWPREVPSHIYDRLMSGFLCHEAHWLLTAMRRDGGYTPDMAIHPGDPFGRVIAWLWETAPEEAIMAVATYMSQVNKWDELAEPQVRLEDILDGLGFAVPHGFPTTEMEALRERARQEVPDL